MIDVLSKYAVVVPIKSKTPPDIIAGTMEGLTPPAIIAGTMEGLHKMGKKCKLLYTDDERGIASADGEGIEGKRTYCLRWKIFRILKDKPFKRVENDEKKGKQNIQWTDYILEIILTYNKDVHSATGLTPNEARKEKNAFKAKLNVSVKASKENMYPTLEVGDRVKRMRKKAITEKEWTNHFLQGEYTVENIATKLGKQYQTLEWFNRPLLRHKWLKRI